MTNKYFFFTIVFLFSCCAFNVAQTIQLVGELKNADTKMPLANATIIDIESQEGVVSDEIGHFSLTLPKNSVNLVFSYVGYQSQRLSLLLTKDTVITIYLTPSLKLQTVEVIASENPRPEEITALSTIQLSAKQINQVPTFLGEQDVLKVLQLLPGVQSGAEGQSGLQVRGGSPDQNLLLMDGIPIYNANHLFGFFSVFNGAITDEVSFVTGGFPAQYAGRLSSIVDIKTKEGDLEHWSTEAAVGMISGKLLVQGPLIKNKTSILLAARRSLLDVWGQQWLDRTYRGSVFDGNSDYFFTDYNAKFFHQLTKKDKLIIRAFSGQDDYKQQRERIAERGGTFNNDLAVNWKNFNASIDWNRIWYEGLTSQLTVFLNNYTYQQERLNTADTREGNRREFFSYGGGIEDMGLKWHFQQQLSEQHQLNYGLQLTQHQFFTGDYDISLTNTTTPDSNVDSTFITPPIRAIEGGLFLEDEWTINSRLSIRGGLHLSAYQAEKKGYVVLQPRLAMRAVGANGVAYKLSYASMQQYLHLLVTENGGFPTDLWLPATENVRPQSGWIIAGQIARTIGGIEFTVEPYYRVIKNSIAYKEGRSIINPEDWQQKVTQGQGKTYGAEFLIRKNTGSFTGWLAYTLSWSRRQFDALNLGNWFPYTYDRRHNLSLVANYQLGKHWRLSGNWVYYTGQAYTLPTHLFPTLGSVNSFGFSSVETLFENGFNNFRFSAYHRLDASIAFLWGKKSPQNSLSLGTYNAYDRNNTAFVDLYRNRFINADGRESFQGFLKQNSLYGLIPFINLKIVFR